ncbi:MAG TPA: peptide ABC transporter substrate-binding protein, partial [Gemmatimonadales bacterium]|nr:peptide ABC transporter substrate-binding protein [Gemmatimonadales bacterium]
QMDRIASVSCPRGPSGRDVRVAWKVRDAYANLTVIGQLARLPRHLVEPFYRADPGRLNVAPYGADARMAIGDGAYRVVEWRTGVSMTLERVPDHGIFGAPRTKRLIWRFFQDFGLFPALLDGAVDVTLGNTSLAFDRAVELDRRRGSGYRVFFVPGLTWEHIDFNLDNPWLKDVRVRQAIAHAVNRTQIIQQTFFGKARLAHSYLPPRHPGHAGDVVTYRYDPSRARTLLADAGLRPGTDGVLRDSAGRRVELELSTRSGVQIREQTQQIIREQLGLVGIDVVIRNFPLREFFSERLGKRRFEAMILYAWVFSPTSDCDLVYTSDGIPTASNTWLGSNYPGYRSAEMDRICKAIPRELDPVRRRDLLQESARLFARDLPALPLYFRIDVAAAKAGLRNIAPRGLGVFETWNTQEWHWE